MTATAIVLTCTPRRSGGYGAVVRLEQKVPLQVLVVSETELEEGRRVRVEGAGMRWNLERVGS
jgi:hypothetical protein